MRHFNMYLAWQCPLHVSADIPNLLTPSHRDWTVDHNINIPVQSYWLIQCGARKINWGKRTKNKHTFMKGCLKVEKNFQFFKWKVFF